MKRILLLTAALLLGTQIVFAQLIDKPVATVKLAKFEVISIKQFRQQIEDLEERTKNKLSAEDRRKLLDLLISEMLISQAASLENVTVTQGEIDSRIALARQTGGLGLNLNRELTEQEFRQLLQQSGLSWEEYVEQLEKAILQQKFVMQKKKALFDKIAPPAETEIEDFYEANKTAFVAPDMVRFRHIYIDTRNLSSADEKNKARTRAEEISRELRNGASFDDLVVKYSDDKNSRYKGGDFGYLRRDDQARRQLLGREFFEAPFKMDIGEISGVLQSNIGFHIIRVTEKIPFRLLALDDPIPPQNNSTVRDQISAQLLQQKQAEFYQQALMDLLGELKKKAEIRIFEENLTW
ncbi:MAG: peptidylprolyl isomerase [Spirochaetaceae bacterium]|nr:MAG: peptidylprolyl isomerase [Spirochaetaceae bacterium]